MPYNKQNNNFEVKINGIFENIGKAIMEWKNSKSYTEIQGLLVDTRFLIYNYDKIGSTHKEQLITAISDIDH